MNKKAHPQGMIHVGPVYSDDERHYSYTCETCQKAWAEGKNRIIKGLHGGKARIMRDYCKLYMIEQMIKNGDYPRDRALEYYYETLEELNSLYRDDDDFESIEAEARSQMIPDPNFSLS